MSNIDRLGFYLVGWKKFYNKTLALLESKKSNYDLTWYFNDHVYGNINWSIPIEESLPSLYLKRAKQLREKYDYLVLYYSGGADSNNILHTFLDNDIFIDEIVMQLVGEDRKNYNNTDLSNRNTYAEIDYVAIPYLNKLKNKLHPNTKIRIQDFGEPTIEVLKKDNWFEDFPLGTNITLGGVGRQYAQVLDNHIVRLADTNKTVCQILGVDKPLVHFDGTDYYAYFLDASAMHAVPVEMSKNEMFTTRYVTEFFYWTPDLPEIVVKQAQEIKRACELDPAKKEMWAKSFEIHVGEFRSVMHPIIYPPKITPKFQVEKPSSSVMRSMDDWFWSTASDEIKHNYLEVINYLEKNINLKYCLSNNIMSGLKGTITRFYKL